MSERPFDRVEVLPVERDDEKCEAYYRTVYENNQYGPVSEGYAGRTIEEALSNAKDAAERDFEGVRVVVLPGDD